MSKISTALRAAALGPAPTLIEAATSICAALRTGPQPLEGLVQATGMTAADLSPALVLLQGRGYAERRTVNGLRSRWVLAGEAINERSALERAWKRALA